MGKTQITLIAGFMISLFLLPLAFGATLSKEDLDKKEEGWYVTGLPLLNFSSDDGFGYGARAYLYYNGSKSDPYFDKSPYFMQTYAQFFQTTTGLSYHELNTDLPYIFGSKFRIKSAFIFDKDKNASLFPLGENSTKNKLGFETGTEYDKYKDYEDEFLKGLAPDNGNYKYNKYTLTKPTFQFFLYRDITEEFKLMGGVEVKKAYVDSWKDRKFELDGHNYTATEDTLLDILQPYGDGGGWTNFVKLGVGYDTRDFEPDPKHGYYVDYSVSMSRGFIGSDFNFYRQTMGARYFLSVLQSLVLATRVAYMDASKNIPFYEMGFFDFADKRQDGLGGNRTLRGYKKERFVGPTMTLGNVELRWQFAEITPWGQRFAFKLVGFVDAGNVYDKAADPFKDPRWGDYKYSYGGGFVIAWNLATIIHVYYGMSPEDTGLFINFEHNF